MKLIPVKSIPEKTNKPSKVHLREILEDFVHSSNDIVKVDYREDGYSSSGVCGRSLQVIIRNNGFPIRVIWRGDDIYLKKEK